MLDLSEIQQFSHTQKKKFTEVSHVLLRETSGWAAGVGIISRVKQGRSPSGFHRTLLLSPLPGDLNLHRSFASTVIVMTVLAWGRIFLFPSTPVQQEPAKSLRRWRAHAPVGSSVFGLFLWVMIQKWSFFCCSSCPSTGHCRLFQVGSVSFWYTPRLLWRAALSSGFTVFWSSPGPNCFFKKPWQWCLGNPGLNTGVVC